MEAIVSTYIYWFSGFFAALIPVIIYLIIADRIKNKNHV